MELQALKCHTFFFAILKALNFNFGKYISDLSESKIPSKSNFMASTSAFYERLDCLNIDLTQNLSGRKDVLISTLGINFLKLSLIVRLFFAFIEESHCKIHSLS